MALAGCHNLHDQFIATVPLATAGLVIAHNATSIYTKYPPELLQFAGHQMV